MSRNAFNAAFDKTLIIEKFVSLKRRVREVPGVEGTQTQGPDKQGFPSANVFARLGSKQELARAIQGYCKNRDGYEDVIALCEPVAAAEMSWLLFEP